MCVCVWGGGGGGIRTTLQCGITKSNSNVKFKCQIPGFKFIHSSSVLHQVKSQKNAEVTAHAEKVMKQIDSSIKKLGDPAGFTAELKALGGRHTGYKVSRAHLAVSSEPVWSWQRIWQPHVGVYETAESGANFDFCNW